ncbi:MAG: glycosyltransferase [Vicinamibacterales bacterium]
MLLVCRELTAGGSERQLTEMAIALDRDILNPFVACFQGRGARMEDLREAGVPVLDLGLTSLKGPSCVQAAARLRTFIREHRIELAHSFDVPSNLFAVPLCRAMGVPSVLSSQRAHRDLTGRLSRVILRMTDRLVDGIVVNSRAMEVHLVRDEGVAPSRIRVCSNGINTEWFTPGPRHAALLQASFVVGTVCVLRPEKSLLTLISAFAQVLQTEPGAQLVIVGDGPEAQSLQQAADALNIRHACAFVGAVSDVRPWLRSFDVFVLPSLSEAFSNSLMEAMSCGCCVVASNVGGNPELVTSQHTGILFPAGNASSLAAALEDLRVHPAKRRALSTAGMQRVHDTYSRAAAARRMVDIYIGYIERLDTSHTSS